MSGFTEEARPSHSELQCYTMHVSTQRSEAVRIDEQAERAQRAERVRAMLKRWAAEDVSDEPDWDVEDIEPVRFRRVVVDRDE